MRYVVSTERKHPANTRADPASKQGGSQLRQVADPSSWPGWLAAGWLAGSLAHGASTRSCTQFWFFLSFGCFCVVCALFPLRILCFFLNVFVSSAAFPLFCWFCVSSHNATRAQRTMQAHVTGDGRYRLFEAVTPSAGILALQRGKSSSTSETPQSRTLRLFKMLNGCCA